MAAKGVRLEMCCRSLRVKMCGLCCETGVNRLEMLDHSCFWGGLVGTDTGIGFALNVLRVDAYFVVTVYNGPAVIVTSVNIGG